MIYGRMAGVSQFLTSEFSTRTLLVTDFSPSSGVLYVSHFVNLSMIGPTQNPSSPRLTHPSYPSDTTAKSPVPSTQGNPVLSLPAAHCPHDHGSCYT